MKAEQHVMFYLCQYKLTEVPAHTDAQDIHDEWELTPSGKRNNRLYDKIYTVMKNQDTIIFKCELFTSFCLTRHLK